jgi:hypothetical protein
MTVENSAWIVGFEPTPSFSIGNSTGTGKQSY